MSEKRILNPNRMRQLIDFAGMELDDGIYPTDIDGFIEYHDLGYIIIEVKHAKAKVPYGQRLALQRAVDDFIASGKEAIAIVCEHHIDDVTQNIIAAKCAVREVYYGREHCWRTPNNPMNVRQAIDSFQKHMKKSKRS